jgi:group I intron endonuclease
MDCGIYRIDGPRGRCYIGQALRLAKRQRDHKNLLRKGAHWNVKLQRAWNKYGEQCFTFSVVEVCLPGQLDELEQQWIDKTGAARHGYNINPAASSPKGCRRTAQFKKQVSETLKKKAADPAVRDRLRRQSLALAADPVERARRRQNMRQMQQEGRI